MSSIMFLAGPSFLYKDNVDSKLVDNFNSFTSEIYGNIRRAASFKCKFSNIETNSPLGRETMFGKFIGIMELKWWLLKSLSFIVLCFINE